MKISLQEKQYFLKNIVSQFFIGSINKTMLAAIFDINGIVIACTDKLAKEQSFATGKELIGKTYFEINGIENLAITRQIEKVRKQVIAEEKPMTYLKFFNYNSGFKAHITLHFPIFFPNGEIAGSHVILTEPYFLTPMEYLSQVYSKYPRKNTFSKEQNIYQHSVDNLLIQLTPRQYEILFLLTHGLSQEDIASILMISRGTIAKTISEKISPKFGISGSSIKLLVDKAIQLGIQHTIPPSLLTPRIIIFDDNLKK